jgi:uncharacterized protein YcfJ
MRQLIPALATFAALPALAMGNSTVIDAPVVDVQPVYETISERIPYESCRQERVRVVERGGRRSLTPVILGAVVGGTAGSVLGRNSSRRDLITGAGALLGGSIGNDRRQHTRHDDGYYVTEDVCVTEYEYREQEQQRGYRVSYRFGDSIYTTRTRNQPGSTIAVRVSLDPLP